MEKQPRILSFDEAREKGARSADGRARSRRSGRAGNTASGASGQRRSGRADSALLSYLSEDDFSVPYEEETGRRSSKRARSGAGRGSSGRDGRSGSSRGGVGRASSSGRSKKASSSSGSSRASGRLSGASDGARAPRADAGRNSGRIPSRNSDPIQAPNRARRPSEPSLPDAIRPTSRSHRSAASVRMAAAAEQAQAVGRASSARQAQEATARDDADDEELPTEITAADRRKAKREAKAKRKAKAKAAEQFRRQFGDDAGASSGEGGSRAAVYKGEMGAKQRQASRMQEKQSKGFSIDGIKGAVSGFSLSALLQSKRFVRGAVVAACVVIFAISLYGPLKNYYCNVREHDRLELEYQALSERNDQLQTEVDSLQTDEGVKARAHDQLGWVEKGEETANVSGLNLEDSTSSSDTVVTANINSDSVKAPRTWYSPVLDFVFGYAKGE